MNILNSLKKLVQPTITKDEAAPCLHPEQEREALLLQATAARDEAAKTKDLLNGILERVSDGFVAFDAEYNYTYVNSRACQLLGRTADELIGKNYWTEYPEARGTPFANAYVQAMETQQPIIFEDYYVHWDRWFINRIYPSHEGITIFFGDITESKRNQEAIKEAHERYSALFNQAMDGILILSKDGRILDLNNSFALMHGYSIDEMRKLTILDLDLQENNEIDPERMGRLMKGESLRFEVQHYHRDGHIFPLEVVASKIVQGQTESIMAFHRDLTGQKEAEGKRKLLEQQLHHSQRMESVGTLASGIAHDFNNILNIVIGNAGMLEHRPDDTEKVRQRAGAILKASDRGAELVKQVLTFARKSETERRTIEVNAIIRDLSKLLAEIFPRKISVRLNLAGGIPNINADPNQLHQVLLNLCVNARDAMAKGGELTIESSLVRGDALRHRFPMVLSVPYVCINIKDTGTGIDEKYLKEIFDPFFTTKEVGKGTGLGLSVVYGIVQSHEGFIDVESHQGKGTEFFVYLPASEEILKTKDEADTSIISIAGGSETILFIDDEELTREITLEHLREKGYHVLVAVDGVEGIKTFSENKNEIAFVLSDLGLPHLSGDLVFKTIKGMKPDLPFILMTGFIEPEKAAELRALGITDILSKPCLPFEILKKVRDVLDGGQR